MDHKFQQISNYKNIPFNFIVYDKDSKDDLHIYPKHWHNHLEIVVTIKGKGYAWVDGHKYNIIDNNVFIINPQALHQIIGYQPFHENIGYCLQIDLSYFLPLLPSLNKTYHITCHEDISKQIIEQCILLDKDIKDNIDSFGLLIRIIKVLKILDQHTTLDSSPIKSDKHKARLLKISSYIQNNYDENLNVSYLAEYFNISVSYLQKLFKDYFQQSVHQYVTEIRMIHAIDDIKYTDLNILDISIKNGFTSHKSFTQEFKKRFQITPKEYRIQQKKDKMDTLSR